MTDPTPMTCRDVFERLESFVDRELRPDEMALVQAHLDLCARCTHQYRFEEGVLETLRRKLQRIAVPPGLRDKVLTSLREASLSDPTHPTPPDAMNPFPLLAAVLTAVLVPGSALRAQQAPPSIAEKTRGMQKLDGFVPLHWDASTGKLFLEISRFDTELLYVVSLPAGVGSNDIGLDRSQLSRSRVVTLQRVGPRVFLVEPNLRYRALSDNPAERRAVRESFATSILWGFQVEAETDGRVLVDATGFVLRDAHGVIGALAQTRQGTYRLDANRSALYLPAPGPSRRIPRSKSC
jgi:mycothiol system anti-sigma-R factor